MHAVLILAMVAVVHLTATAVPGPTTFVVIRVALTRSRRAAAGAAVGIMLADAGWALAAMAGISVVFARYPGLYRALEVTGGAYLLYLAARTWRSARRALTSDIRLATGRSTFAAGALTNLTNPKSVVFFGSIFAAVLPPGTPLSLRIAAVGVVAINALSWHLMLGCAFSMPRAHQIYRPLKPAIDRITAALMAAFGGLLIGEAR
jgi:threonine/homoserine/homoserine lactone efflux protein